MKRALPAILAVVIGLVGAFLLSAWAACDSHDSMCVVTWATI